jgi:hypothetical protein
LKHDRTYNEGFDEELGTSTKEAGFDRVIRAEARELN